MPDNASHHCCLYQKPAVTNVLAISLPGTCLFPTACYTATAPCTIGVTAPPPLDNCSFHRLMGYGSTLLACRPLLGIVPIKAHCESLLALLAIPASGWRGNNNYNIICPYLLPRCSGLGRCGAWAPSPLPGFSLVSGLSVLRLLLR